jgi:hypothetical protein
MEAEGRARIARHLFESYMVFIEEYVSDNDLSCCKMLTHSFWDLILVGRLTEADLPRHYGPGSTVATRSQTVDYYLLST